MWLIGCINDIPPTVYRHLGPLTSSSPPPSSSSSPASSSQSQTLSTGSGLATQSSTATSAITTALSAGTHSSHSKAWIAGAVVGPIGAIVLAALLIWALTLRHRLSKTEKPAEFVGVKLPNHTAGFYGNSRGFSQAQQSGSREGEHSRSVSELA
jgi:hypothetical protein